MYCYSVIEIVSSQSIKDNVPRMICFHPQRKSIAITLMHLNTTESKCTKSFFVFSMLVSMSKLYIKRIKTFHLFDQHNCILALVKVFFYLNGHVYSVLLMILHNRSISTAAFQDKKYIKIHNLPFIERIKIYVLIKI